MKLARKVSKYVDFSVGEPMPATRTRGRCLNVFVMLRVRIGLSSRRVSDLSVMQGVALRIT